MARKKINRKPGHSNAKANHEAWLRSMGIDPNKKAKRPKKGIYSVPDYKTSSTNTIKTSDTICSNGTKRNTNTYTGDELAGVALMHKQSYEPIRKDNKQAAVASAQMRRN